MTSARQGNMIRKKILMPPMMVERIDQDLRRINERLIRLETMVEITTNRKSIE